MKNKSRIEKFLDDGPEFDEFASNYDEELGRVLKSVGDEGADYFVEYKIKELARRLGMEQPRRFLNFGCGTGNSEVFLVKYFCDTEFHGIDVSSRSIHVAQERNLPKTKFGVYDGNIIPYPDDSFDVIFISNVLHHINHFEHYSVMIEINRVLRKGGSVFVFEHNPLNPLTQKVVRECEFDRDAHLLYSWETKSLLKRAGFHDVSCSFTLFFPKVLSFLRRFEKYMTYIPIGAQYYCSALKK
jgi:ubiquinone/menaquinone biosynthesis C-methylase UbiE